VPAERAPRVGQGAANAEMATVGVGGGPATASDVAIASGGVASGGVASDEAASGEVASDAVTVSATVDGAIASGVWAADDVAMANGV